MVDLSLVDAFVSARCRGNPAGVCLPGAAVADAGWMQAVASELGAAETAFAWPIATAARSGDDLDAHVDADVVAGAWALRWFTPLVEVPLCGHATLATAHVLWETGRVPAGTGIRFETASGVLSAHRAADGRVELDFPSLPVTPLPVPAAAAAAIGVPVVAAAGRDDWLLLEVVSASDVARIEPDLDAVRALQPHAVVVTGAADSNDEDFVSRVFAPNEGIDEDPVTGSAHCVLGPYWASRFGRADLVGRQASRRGGIVRVCVADDRVVLGGHARIFLRGTIERPPG